MAIAHLYLELLDQKKAAVRGDVLTKNFANQIECDDWSWKVENKEAAQVAGIATGQGNRIEPSILTFSKAPDRSSTRLMKAIQTGELFAKATFTLFEELQGRVEDTEGSFHLRLVLTDVRVLRYELSGKTSDKEVTLEETWDLTYRTITFQFDEGKQQVLVTRPPGSDDSRSASKVDQLEKEGRGLTPNERKDLIGRLGKLD